MEKVTIFTAKRARLRAKEPTSEPGPQPRLRSKGAWSSKQLRYGSHMKKSSRPCPKDRYCRTKTMVKIIRISVILEDKDLYGDKKGINMANT